ncbi:MAG: hypothetical protein RL695_16 [Pseudomonadota bacterium]|jgi:hypothetical protein
MPITFPALGGIRHSIVKFRQYRMVAGGVQ